MAFSTGKSSYLSSKPDDIPSISPSSLTHQENERILHLISNDPGTPNTQNRLPFALQWIKQGKPCVYMRGFYPNFTNAHAITKEDALYTILHYHYSFNPHSYLRLKFRMINNTETLVINNLECVSPDYNPWTDDSLISKPDKKQKHKAS